MPYKRKNQGRQFADNQGLEQIVWAPVRLAGNVQDAVNVARIAKVRLEVLRLIQRLFRGETTPLKHRLASGQIRRTSL